MRAAFAKTVLVVDEGSLASTVQTRNLLRIARELRLPRVVLVGDGKQLDAVDAGKPFVQLQNAGMKTATMGQIMRQKDADLKAAVEASLAGDIKKAFQKLGPNVVAVKPDNLPGGAAARWLKLSPEQRENTGLMAPSHALRVQINEIVCNRLIRDGHVTGSAPNDSSPGGTPTPRRRSPPTTPKETWSHSTGRTSGWVSKRAMNCAWQASTAKQTPSI